ncbi:hypothetical protein UFOVP376_19 [uncultured Caudovirales phage]|uniref:Uncharacterized protein n=1 Tax=uncultured Caudovirales phage TaxID=2100421 RepID=A0A6J7X0Q6_9CAUD|nr:hypothetical protein UFOVP376_19 [uncultured Caudovirales phage]
MKDNAEVAKDYTDWHIKTGGFARDMTLRDVFAALAMQTLTLDWSDERIVEIYQIADAMIRERNK